MNDRESEEGSSMLYVRGRTCWVKRALPGIGPVRKTLGTQNKTQGEDLERILLKLCEQGRQDLVRHS